MNTMTQEQYEALKREARGHVNPEGRLVVLIEDCFREQRERDLIVTKHGGKARNVTPEQEAALDNMAAAPSSYGRIDRVNVLNESFANTVYVYTDDSVDPAPQIYLIAQDGSVARIV